MNPPTHCPRCACPLDAGEACAICAAGDRMKALHFTRRTATRPAHAQRTQPPDHDDDTRRPAPAFL